MRWKVLGASALMGLALMGCSKTDSSTSTGSGGGTTTAAVSSKLTKAAFIEQADKICKEHSDKIKDIPEPKDESEIAAYLEKGIKEQQASIAAVKKLGEPDSGADELKAVYAKAEAFFKLLEEKIPEIEKDPSLVTSDESLDKAQDEMQEAAKKFGFKECGVDGSSSSSGSGSSGSGSSTTAKKTTTTKAGSGSSSGGSSSSSGELDVMQCAELAIANLELTAASDTSESKKAAGKVLEFDPPADVASAVEYLAESGGLQVTDENTIKASEKVTNWVDEVCPG